MTKFDIYVMINKSNSQLGQAMEEYIKRKEIFMGDELNKTHRKNKNMTELHTNLKEAADYFIELFKVTGRKYSCSRTKLGKLLSIVAFIYAKQNKKLFDEKIYKYKSDSSEEFCGTGIQELNFLIGRDAYSQMKFNNDNNKKIPCEDLEKCEKINTSLSFELRRTIEKVFFNFGAYNPEILGQCINPIIVHKGITLDDGSIDLIQLSELSKNNFSELDFNLSSSGVRKDLIYFLCDFPNNSEENK